MSLTNNFLHKEGVECPAGGHEGIACNKLQDSDESPMALTDVLSPVPLDHVMDQDSNVADDQESLDTTSDMGLPTQQSVPCSESNVSTTSPYTNGMKCHSSGLPEEITSGLGNLCLAEKHVSMGQLKSMVPEQVANEMEPSCCDMTDKILSNLGNVSKMVSNAYTVMSNSKQPAEQLKRLNISPRSRTSTNSFNYASVCELRSSLSHEEQDTCCGDMKDKMGEDGYYEQPCPPGIPPAITGLRLINLVEPKLIQQVAEYLGRGGFGSVFKAYDQDTGILLAIKRVPFMKEGKDKVMKEVHIMNTLRHPNIITMLGSQVLEMECQIFLEWMAGGSIEQLLSQYGPMSSTVIQSYSKQVLSGIAYLHEQEILHCDVKGANIVVDSTGQVAKLCDFGEAVKMPVPEGMEGKGTVPFMAPELFQGDCNSRGSDVWSVGCTMLQMATGKAPWSEFNHFGEECVKFKICTQELPIPSSLPLLLRKAIADCLQKDVTNRPTAHELQCRLAIGLSFLEDISAFPYVHDYHDY